MGFLYGLGRALTFIFLPTFGQVEVVGKQHIPRNGGFIIASNHQSIADPPLIVFAFNRPVFFMAKKGLFKTRIVSFFLRALHMYPVNRTGVDIDAIKWAEAILGAGRVLLIFPEGTRSPYHLKEGNDGIAYIVSRTKVPVLPVAITGTEEIKNVLRIPFHFKKIKVSIGEPFRLPEETSNRTKLKGNTGLIMRNIAVLLPASYRGAYKKENA